MDILIDTRTVVVRRLEVLADGVMIPWEVPLERRPGVFHLSAYLPTLGLEPNDPVSRNSLATEVAGWLMLEAEQGTAAVPDGVSYFDEQGQWSLMGYTDLPISGWLLPSWYHDPQQVPVSVGDALRLTLGDDYARGIEMAHDQRRWPEGVTGIRTRGFWVNRSFTGCDCECAHDIMDQYVFRVLGVSSEGYMYFAYIELFSRE